jgi:oligoribonuclease NrnB/cAMP/cGMP phosphodiesterase (DHH superfamily)
MKNLANCKPSEFLKQTAKIRRSVSKWLTVTDIMNIRKRLPELPDDVTKEEKDDAMIDQGMKNMDAILEAVLEDHPDETLEVLALLCFVEPANVDDYPMSLYFDSFNELINNNAVKGFFISLVRLVNQNT